MSALSEMPVQELLRKVEARGVRLQAKGGHISIGWPEKTPDPEIRQALIDRKPEILEALGENPTPSAYPFGGDIEFMNTLTEDQKQYYLDLLEIMQSPKFGLDRKTALQEAEKIIQDYLKRKRERANAE